MLWNGEAQLCSASEKKSLALAKGGYMEQIENCPHCGGPGQMKEIPKPYRHGWVGCQACGIYKNWTYSPMEAIVMWNRRAA